MDTATVDPDGTVRLLSAILAGVQPLPGAKCVGQHELYDERHGGYGRRHRDQERERLARAAACCAGCPARTKCTTVTTSSTVTVISPSHVDVANPRLIYRF
ncbi:MAG: hypothetical protein ACRDQU_09185 [Pseudonocardiaceae bacterium]